MNVWQRGGAYNPPQQPQQQPQFQQQQPYHQPQYPQQQPMHNPSQKSATGMIFSVLKHPGFHAALKVGAKGVVMAGRGAIKVAQHIETNKEPIKQHLKTILTTVTDRAAHYGSSDPNHQMNPQQLDLNKKHFIVAAKSLNLLGIDFAGQHGQVLFDHVMGDIPQQANKLVAAIDALKDEIRVLERFRPPRGGKRRTRVKKLKNTHTRRRRA